MISFQRLFEQAGLILTTCLLLHSSYRTLESLDYSSMKSEDLIFILLAIIFLISVILTFASLALPVLYGSSSVVLASWRASASKTTAPSANFTFFKRVLSAGNTIATQDAKLSSEFPEEYATTPPYQHLPLPQHWPSWEYSIALEV